jgi:hypothetical protein
MSQFIHFLVTTSASKRSTLVTACTTFSLLVSDIQEFFFFNTVILSPFFSILHEEKEDLSLPIKCSIYRDISSARCKAFNYKLAVDYLSVHLTLIFFFLIVSFHSEKTFPHLTRESEAKNNFKLLLSVYEYIFIRLSGKFKSIFLLLLQCLPGLIGCWGKM